MPSRASDSPEVSAIRTLLDRREFLEALRDGPKDKRTLEETTDVSRSTVNRAVRDLETAHLVERTNGEYQTTAYGELLAEEFTSLLDSASFAWQVRDVLEQVTTAELDFELSRLADAEITTPTPANPGAPMDRVVEIKQNASTLRSLASGRSPGALDAHERGAGNSDVAFESVCSVDLVSWLVSDPERREQLAGLLEHDGVSVYAYDGDIPVPIGITEDVAFFGVESPEGAPVALVESTDDRVREWAVERFESARDAADELVADDLAVYAST